MPSGVNKLTAIQIKNSGDGKLQDGGGLILHKKGAGGKWIYRYSFSGRRREMGLGSFPDFSLAEARKERNHWQQVLARGSDPISERNRSKADELAELNKHDPSFKEAAQTTFEAKQGGLRGEGKAGRWLSPITHYMVPKIGPMRMSEIHQSDIHKALKPIWRKKHPTAEKAIQRTKIIFEHMRLSGVDCDPFIVDMAKHMLGEYQHKPKSMPASSWQDVPRIFEALDRNDSSHLCLRFKILTAMRSAAVRGARFDEIEGDVWTVPADRMKGREGMVGDFRVPLSSQALELIERARSWRVSPFMFPGGRGGGISDVAINKVFNKIDPDGTPHGLRTSFRTWVQDTEAATYDVAETALAHIIGSKVERAYARSDLLDRRRLLMQKWADHVTMQAGDVVNFPNFQRC